MFNSPLSVYTACEVSNNYGRFCGGCCFGCACGLGCGLGCGFCCWGLTCGFGRTGGLGCTIGRWAGCVVGRTCGLGCRVCGWLCCGTGCRCGCFTAGCRDGVTDRAPGLVARRPLISLGLTCFAGWVLFCNGLARTGLVVRMAGRPCGV